MSDPVIEVVWEDGRCGLGPMCPHVWMDEDGNGGCRLLNVEAEIPQPDADNGYGPTVFDGCPGPSKSGKGYVPVDKERLDELEAAEQEAAKLRRAVAEFIHGEMVGPND